MIKEKEIEEAKELLKDGYINVTLWRRLLLIKKHHLIGEEFKYRQAINKLESDIDI
ncbi:hypothetical protein ES703_34075 [subsurface metagenome]